MSEFIRLNEQKRAVVDESTALSVMTGLAIRYHRVLKGQFDDMEQLASIVNDPDASKFNSVILPRMRLALNAEVPLAFCLQPSNMAVCINVLKIDPITGNQLVLSDVNVGLMGGLAKDGQPSDGFTSDDLSFAVQRLREQLKVGLIYGLPPY